MNITKQFLIWAMLGTVTGAVFADPPESSEVERLVAQLNSNNYSERASASKSLEKLGAAAVPALRIAVKNAEPEVAERINVLIAKFEREADAIAAFEPTKVRISAKDSPLADVINDLAKQARIRIRLAAEPVDLPGRRITMDIPEKPFFEVLDELCRRTKTSLRPGVVDPAAENENRRNRFRMAIDLDSGPTELVIQDGTLPSCPTVYLGSARVRLIPDRWGNRSRESDAPKQWKAEVLSEPRMEWQSSPQISFNGSPALSIEGKTSDDDPTMRMNQRFRRSLMMADLFNDGATLRSVQSVEIPVAVKSNSVSGSKLEIKGALAGTLRVGTAKLIEIADVTAGEAPTASSKDKTKITVVSCRVAENGSVKLKVEFEQASDDPMFGALAMVRVGGFRAGGRAEAQPAKFAQLVAGNEGDDYSVCLSDAQGRPYMLTAGDESVDRKKNNLSLTKTITCEPADKDSKPRRLELYAPRTPWVAIEFNMKDVPVP